MRERRGPEQVTHHHLAHHRVEVIVAAGGAHLALISEVVGDDVADAERQVYDRAAKLGPAVCVGLETTADPG